MEAAVGRVVSAFLSNASPNPSLCGAPWFLCGNRCADLLDEPEGKRGRPEPVLSSFVLGPERAAVTPQHRACLPVARVPRKAAADRLPTHKGPPPKLSGVLLLNWDCVCLSRQRQNSHQALCPHSQATTLPRVLGKRVTVCSDDTQ